MLIPSGKRPHLLPHTTGTALSVLSVLSAVDLRLSPVLVLTRIYGANRILLDQ